MPQSSLEIGPLPSLADVEFVERLGLGMGAGRFKARLAEGARPLVSLLVEDGRNIDRQSFADWAQNLGAADHPGVPRLVQLERVLEPAYAAFDYVEGQNLEIRVALRGKGLPEVEALAVVMQAAAALQAAHRVGVPHGALNARSIVLNPRDGGIDTVRVVGWAPPRRGHTQGVKDDVRGLGRLLYTALSGIVPPSARADFGGDALDGPGGDVGAFDGILMDWVDVERDLRGMGRPALRAISEASFASVDAFIDELLPHFRQRVNETIDQIDRDLSRDMAFKAEVDSRRERQRELDAKLRYVRDWLRDNQIQIERVEAEMHRLAARERSLRALEVEVAMLTDRPARPVDEAPRRIERRTERPQDRVDRHDEREAEGGRTGERRSVRADASRSAVASSRPLPRAPTPFERLDEVPTAAPARPHEVVESVLMAGDAGPEAAREGHPARARMAAKDRAKGGEGMMVLALAALVGALVGGGRLADEPHAVS